MFCVCDVICVFRERGSCLPSVSSPASYVSFLPARPPRRRRESRKLWATPAHDGPRTTTPLPMPALPAAALPRTVPRLPGPPRAFLRSRAVVHKLRPKSTGDGKIHVLAPCCPRGRSAQRKRGSNEFHGLSPECCGCIHGGSDPPAACDARLVGSFRPCRRGGRAARGARVRRTHSGGGRTQNLVRFVQVSRSVGRSVGRLLSFAHCT